MGERGAVERLPYREVPPAVGVEGTGVSGNSLIFPVLRTKRTFISLKHTIKPSAFFS